MYRFISPRRVSAAVATAITLMSIGSASAAVNNSSTINLNTILSVIARSRSRARNEVSNSQVSAGGQTNQSLTVNPTATSNSSLTVNTTASNSVSVIQQ